MFVIPHKPSDNAPPLPGLLFSQAAMDLSPGEILDTLRERVKALECLHRVMRVLDSTGRTVGGVLYDVAVLLPSGFQHPHDVRACLQWRDERADTLGSAQNIALVPSLTRIDSDLLADGQVVGRISVMYVTTPPEGAICGFLPEERLLMDTVAARLSCALRRQEVEAALKKSEQRFQAVFEQSRQPTALLENGVFAAVNSASLQMLGLEDAASLLGRSPAELSPTLQPDGQFSKMKAAALMAQALADGYIEFEWVFFAEGGCEGSLTARVRLTAIVQEDRKLLHVSWFDITPHKALEYESNQYRLELERHVRERTDRLSRLSKALQTLNDEQETILNTATSGIALLKDRVLVRCNRRLHELFGWQLGDMVGKSTAIWYPDEAANIAGGEGVYEHIWRGEAHSREQQLMRRDGSLFWARLTGNAVDVNDHSKGSVWVIDDITNERAVIEQLARARKLAEQTARIKANFIANVSHELRTPMNAIIGFSELTLAGELTDEQRSNVERIATAGEQMLTLVNEVIDYAALDAGSVTVKDVEFDVRALLQTSVDKSARAVMDKDLQFAVRIEDGVPARILGDVEHIRQVLEQLLSNAVKFTEKGVIRLNVGREHVNGDTMFRFSVSDTGIGIQTDEARKLFQRFRQVDESPTRRYVGMGLGLAISKRLVELMGGRIGFESVPGMGSTFWFTIVSPGLGNCAETSNDRARAPVIVSEMRAENFIAPGRTSILLVEDNPVNQLVAATILRKAGFVVDIAANGAIALSKVQSRTYDAVLMDSQMPVMDGVTATREIRKLPGLQSLPIIALSANCEPQQVVEYLDSGMNDHLVKPIDSKNLLATLTRWISQ